MFKSGKNRYYQTIYDQFHLNCSGMCNLHYYIRDSGGMNYRFKITGEVTYRGCLCDNWKSSFLSLLIFDWCTFWRQVTARWWRQSAKNQVSTNQNSRNRWCHIVSRTICIGFFKSWKLCLNLCFLKWLTWTKWNSCNTFDSIRIVAVIKRIRRRSHEFYNFFLEDVEVFEFCQTDI